MDDEKERKLKTAIENVKYLEAQITVFLYSFISP
jgi:hypothetical protein